MQKRVLRVIEEEKFVNRYNIIKKTNLKKRTLIKILSRLANKGLITRKWYLGFYLYPPTGVEYEYKTADNEDEDNVLRLLKEHKGIHP